MKRRITESLRRPVLIALGCVLLSPGFAWAHCDSLNGPVVIAARTALEKRDVTPVLKWVMKEYEPEVRAAFQKALAVRVASPQAKELADHYFFETVVRLHRLGEGEPYTGLKAANVGVSEAIQAADKALENGQVDLLVKRLTQHIEAEVRERFANALKKKKLAEGSVAAGREFVAAYVEFIHFVESLETGPAHAQPAKPGARTMDKH